MVHLQLLNGGPGSLPLSAAPQLPENSWLMGQVEKPFVSP